MPDTLVDLHRIGGAGVGNLVLKPAEENLYPPGISVLMGGEAEQAASDIRRVFGSRSVLGKRAAVVGSASLTAVRTVGFDVIPDPTNNFPNHGRLIHPDGVAGFSVQNLAGLSAVFVDRGGL